MDSLSELLDNNGFVMWIRSGGSLWGYPAILFLHTLGLATAAGLSAGIDLRILGFAPKLPLASLARCGALIWAAFWISAASGALLVLNKPHMLEIPIFYIKLVFVVLALVTVQSLKSRVFSDPLLDTKPLSPNAKVLAVTSLTFWIAATTAGRLIAYLE